MDRILIVTNCLTGGGAERSMNLLANELYVRGRHVALLPINDSGEDLVKQLCPVFPLGRTWKGGLGDFVKSYFRYLSLIRKWKPTVIILNCDLPELFGALTINHKARLIVVEHTNHPFAGRILLGKIIRKILVLKGSEFVAVSSHLEIWQVPTKIKIVLLNAIQFDSKGPERLVEKSIATLRNVYFIGRLATIQKRPQVILEIASRFKGKFIIIGDGEAKKEIQERILRESLNVELLGYVEDPWQFLSKEDILIVPSLFEGDGMVVIEAISRDLPILLSDIPDFRRFGFPDCNYCAEPTDFVQRLTEHSLQIDNLRIPAQVRRELLESRTPKSVGDQWISYLDSGSE